MDIVQEPNAIYQTENNSISHDSEKLHPILEKLILKSIQDAKDGKGISHEEMMRRVKLRYPFLK
ncbi:hypothetical protein [Flavobacterium yafengii]|uniref:hypothetical protein n=1 Tax=Flavobacterium yafengii TaxID=3041253 RepID=UPI0024A8BFDF|nr:hypothetical protein [Flavobacterium yafengii]MDI5897391.1 hypothetical protein [Flavobacterium yafengii]